MDRTMLPRVGFQKTQRNSTQLHPSHSPRHTYLTPTPSCSPQRAGKNVIGTAKTGSGKTAAFALPILHQLAKDPYGVFALVLTPTRELAMQISEQFRALGHPIRLRDCVVIGGKDIIKQSLELAKMPHVIVATPGRLASHLASPAASFDLEKLRFLVLDEADRLLEASFAEDLKVIFDHLPKERQTLLFSATMTQTLIALQKRTMVDPFVYQETVE